jgi:hypothetical protein
MSFIMRVPKKEIYLQHSGYLFVFKNEVKILIN